MVRRFLDKNIIEIFDCFNFDHEWILEKVENYEIALSLDKIYKVDIRVNCISFQIDFEDVVDALKRV